MIHIKRVIHIIIIPAVNKNTPPWLGKESHSRGLPKETTQWYQMPFSLRDNCPEATETEAVTFLSDGHPEIGSFHPEAEASRSDILSDLSYFPSASSIGGYC